MPAIWASRAASGHAEPAHKIVELASGAIDETKATPYLLDYR